MPTRPSATTPSHETVVNAVIVAGPELLAGQVGQRATEPAYRRDSLRGSGVRRADGTQHPLAHSRYRNVRFSPGEIFGGPEILARLSGKSIFGGILGQNFGHNLTQSIGRLWAADLAPDAPILFLPETPDTTSIPVYFHDLARSLDVRNPLKLVAAATACDSLLVPEDICNLEHRPCASPYFADWLTLRRPHPLQQGGPAELVYVSRSGLGYSQGQYLQETVLEDALAANGYLTFRPEVHPVSKQIAVYAAARKLIFADGSAVHLWSMVAQPGQDVSVILRRPPEPRLDRWFRSLNCPQPTVVDYGIADFSRRGEGRHRTIALLDLRSLWTRLRALGFHKDPLSIGSERGELDAWLAASAPNVPDPGTLPFPSDTRSLGLLSRCRHVAVRPDFPQAGVGPLSGIEQPP